MLTFFIIAVFQVHAQEVIRPIFNKKINLVIVRAEPDSFETYSLRNHNGREMTLVCAKNHVYDDNQKAMIRYRNFYGEEVGDFTIENNQVCKDIGRFIESASAGIDSERPFLITLDPNKLSVERIVYPRVNPFLDEGDMNDLLPKERIYVAPKTLVPLKKALH